MKSVYTYFGVFVMFLLMVVAAVGCSAFQTSYDKNLAIWRSPDTSPDQRIGAVTQLIPVETKKAKAEQILGMPSRSFQFYGPVFYALGYPCYESATNVAYCDVSVSYYDFTNGNYVALAFDMGPPDAKREHQPFLDTWIGNTNVNTFALTPSGKE
jgi:hypothetical protein